MEQVSNLLQELLDRTERGGGPLSGGQMQKIRPMMIDELFEKALLQAKEQCVLEEIVVGVLLISTRIPHWRTTDSQTLIRIWNSRKRVGYPELAWFFC